MTDADDDSGMGGLLPGEAPSRSEVGWRLPAVIRRGKVGLPAEVRLRRTKVGLPNARGSHGSLTIQMNLRQIFPPTLQSGDQLFSSERSILIRTVLRNLLTRIPHLDNLPILETEDVHNGDLS